MPTLETKRIHSGHKDIIHDVAFDWYGNRMATCSSDQNVKIWERSETDREEWVCTASWKTHFGSVWKVTWAHPEFGQVIATCSFDRTAVIWEEVNGESSVFNQGEDATRSLSPQHSLSVDQSSGPPTVRSGVTEKQKKSGQSWVKRTSLVDSRTSVTDVKFAPRHLGLLLATCSADGLIRIYEAADVMNLGEWGLQHEIPCKIGLSCISWNPSTSRSYPPTIAVGSDDQTSQQPKVMVFELNKAARRWIRVDSFINASKMSQPVFDVEFAPNVGRSYHILAVASKELKIITLKPTNDSLVGGGSSGAGGRKAKALVVDDEAVAATKYEVRLAGQYDDHESTVWRLCWNVTGTILATSGDDGQIKLWKANYRNEWKCVATLHGDGRGGEVKGFPGSAFAN